jgi:hypothetical protein
VLVARLVEVLADMSTDPLRSTGWRAYANCYRCLDPNSVVMTAWTGAYLVLIFYVMTYGLFVASFGTSDLCAGVDDGAFAPQQWCAAPPPPLSDRRRG